MIARLCAALTQTTRMTADAPIFEFADGAGDRLIVAGALVAVANQMAHISQVKLAKRVTIR